MSKIEVNAIEPQTGTTLTLGASGDTVTLAAGATSSGFGATYNGAVNWSSTIQTTGFTAVSGNGYFCNTTSGAFTVTLPATPTAGAIVALKDYAKTWNTNNLTIGRNGSNIEGSAVNSIQNTQGQSVTFIYVDTTKGWVIIDSAQTSEITQATYITATGGTVTTCGNYKIHTFNSTGCFVVSSVGNPLGSDTVDYLVVAGGGAGGGGIGGGGGAGGLRFSASTYTAPPTSSPRAGSALPVAATTYPVTIGAGSASTSSTVAPPGLNRGSNSVFSTITSTGGGAGGNGQTGGGACSQGQTGGSGGAGGYNASGGSGNTPPVSPSQGNTGGAVHPNNVDTGGGGGAGAVGANGVCGVGGAGGDGLQINITGSNTYYAGGGGGINYNCGSTSCTSGAGGLGGGGAGGKGNWSSPAPLQAVAGTANTGGGGGGGNEANGPGPNPQGGPQNSQRGASGGSGVVIIRYKYQ